MTKIVPEQKRCRRCKRLCSLIHYIYLYYVNCKNDEDKSSKLIRNETTALQHFELWVRSVCFCTSTCPSPHFDALHLEWLWSQCTKARANQWSPRVPWEEPADLDPYIAQSLSHLPRPAHTSPWEAFTAAPLPTSRFKSTSGAVFKATLFVFFSLAPLLGLGFEGWVSSGRDSAALAESALCCWGHLAEVAVWAQALNCKKKKLAVLV